MDTRYLSLLRILIDQYPNSVTAQTLSNNLNLTARSIKNYIKEINVLYPDAINSSRKGYNVNLAVTQALLSSNRESVPQTSKQRVAFILKALLQRHELNKFDICEELFISISTLQSILGRIKKELWKFDLKLNTEKDNISIIGSEQNKRKLYSNVLYEESHSSFLNLAAIQDAFPDIDVFFIKDTLCKFFEDYHHFANDYILTNIVLHITIAIDRVQNRNINLETAQKEHNFEKEKQDAVKKIVLALEQKFEITFNDNEIYELTALLTYRVNLISGMDVNMKTITSIVDPDTMDLVKVIIQATKELYDINLGDEYYFTTFALHINNMLNRSRNYSYSKNPLTDSIKTSSPILYEIAVFISSLIKKHTRVVINDDEIAYIAMHLGNAFCAQREYDTKIRAILYCPNYYNLNNQLAQMIEERFSSDLILTDIITDESQLGEYNSYDLLISTVNLSNFYTANYVFINIFLQGKSTFALKHEIEIIQLQKKRNRFENHLRNIMIQDFFEINIKLVTGKQTIRHMVNRMVSLGYVNPSFEDEVFERESISSTAFTGFAIPHSLKMNAYRTGMYMLINPDGIDWRGTPVQLVLMLCFKPDERHIFHEIFDSLTMVFSEQNYYKQIIQCKTYEEFVQLITSLVE